MEKDLKEVLMEATGFTVILSNGAMARLKPEDIDEIEVGGERIKLQPEQKEAE